MDILIKLLQFILSLSLLVIVHEFGHFLFARIFKTRVEKFYLFFNPWFSLFKFRKGETEYGIGWIPFGGYVKISGMIDESMDTDQMKQPVQPYEFRAKPAWQRLLIMVGGVVMNIVLALRYTSVMGVGQDLSRYQRQVRLRLRRAGQADRVPRRRPDRGHKRQTARRRGQVAPDDRFRPGGIRDRRARRETGAYRNSRRGDGRAAQLRRLRRAPHPVRRRPGGRGRRGGQGRLHGGRHARFAERRADAVLRPVPPRVRPVQRRYRPCKRHARLGRNHEAADIARTSFRRRPDRRGADSAGPSAQPEHPQLYVLAGDTRRSEAHRRGNRQLRQADQADVHARNRSLQVAGRTDRDRSIFPDHWSWIQFWHITAFLSIVLAIMNILPIPALDGGHVLFLLVEVVTGRRPSDKFLERAQMAGLMILLALLIFANGNDIYRFFIK
ncbi:MAG: site-2 protease family protein [Alistipes ihumii]